MFTRIVPQLPASARERLKRVAENGMGSEKEAYRDLMVYMEHGACDTVPESGMFGDDDPRETDPSNWGGK